MSRVYEHGTPVRLIDPFPFANNPVGCRLGVVSEGLAGNPNALSVLLRNDEFVWAYPHELESGPDVIAAHVAWRMGVAA